MLSVSRDHDAVVVRVRDTGVGMSAELLPHVFDLFTQDDASLARSGGGLGIGLTIVQKLVALHGGSITAHSEGSGAGSEFVVRLPIGTAGPPREKASQPQPERVVPSHVLVIEDDLDSREMLRTCLELNGHQVEVAPDGPSGCTSRTDSPTGHRRDRRRSARTRWVRGGAADPTVARQWRPAHRTDGLWPARRP